MKAAIFFLFLSVSYRLAAQNEVAGPMYILVDSLGKPLNVDSLGNPVIYGSEDTSRSADTTQVETRKVVRRPVIDAASTEEGTIAVEMMVDEEGKVVSVRYNPARSTSGSEYLIQKAIRAAKTIQFEPKPGSGIERITQTFEFRIP
jgi:TonB family protein